MPSDVFKKRTFDFGIRCVRVVEALPHTLVAQVIGKQLLRAGTSVGANYRSAVRGRSRADFVAKMGIVEEECDEALHWIEVLCALELVSTDRTRDLQIEGNEILSITISSIKTARKNTKP
jgi:four helix bundle protein